MKAFFPTADELLAADRAHLAETVLRHLKTYEGGGTVHQPVGGFNRDYYIAVMEAKPRYLGTLPTQSEYGDKQSEVSGRVREAWQRLVTQSYLMQNSEMPGTDWFVITSEGEELLKRFRHGSLPSEMISKMLPRQALHPKLSDKPWQDFMRGDFGSAVFEAMKAVEVSVRDAGGFGNNILGTQLMRQAFAVDSGPLTDTNVERGEQSARMDFFAGAIGSYKNPHSHREVGLVDPMEAAEIILLANHLLRIVDTRARARTRTSVSGSSVSL
jgi:uncharacterized protein (TIGR02391 family)